MQFMDKQLLLDCMITISHAYTGYHVKSFHGKIVSEKTTTLFCQICHEIKTHKLKL